MHVQRISGTSNYNTSFAAKPIINGGFHLNKEDYNKIKQIIEGIGSENDTITVDIGGSSQDEASWSEMGHKYYVMSTSQDIYVKSVIGGETIEGNLSYLTKRNVDPREKAANNINDYLLDLRLELNMFDINVVGQKFIDDNTIQFYNKKGDIVSEVTLLGKNSVKIKKTLKDKSEATIIDDPKQTKIEQRNRPDKKDIDIIVYKGELEGQMLITVDGHKIKINRKNSSVIEADPVFKHKIYQSISALSEEVYRLENWAYDNYVGPYDVCKYMYHNEDIIDRTKKLFEMGDDAWKDCGFFAVNSPYKFRYYIVKEDNKSTKQ